MELLLILILIPFVITLYLIIFGTKNCYYCGHLIKEGKRPIFLNGKRACERCWLRDDIK